MRTTQEYQAIAASGAGFTVDASRFQLLDLRAIAASARAAGSRLTIVNAGHFSTQELEAIGASGKGVVTFTDI